MGLNNGEVIESVFSFINDSHSNVVAPNILAFLLKSDGRNIITIVGDFEISGSSFLATSTDESLCSHLYT